MVVTIDKVNKVQALAVGPQHKSAELIALTRALELFQGKYINTYIDSKYAFMVVHAHGQYGKKGGS